MLVFDRENNALIEPSKWGSEADLDDFIFRHPEALSALLYPGEGASSDEEDTPPGGWTRLIPLGTQLWCTDVLFLRLYTGAGGAPALLVCENKRRNNPDHPRKVLGQVVDYVSLLADMDDQEFASEVKAAYARPEVQKVVKMLVDETDLEESVSKEAVAMAIAAQKARRIEAVICADELRPELVRMTHWLNKAVRGTSTHSFFTACEISPLDDQAKRSVALAAAVAQIGESDIDLLGADELEQLQKNAKALLASPTFQVAIAEVKTLGTGRIALQQQVQPTPRRSQADRIQSIEQWLSLVPSPDVKALYESLTEELAEAFGSLVGWQPGRGTGTQLCLSVKVDGVDKPIGLLRLWERHATLLFPGKPDEPGQFASCASWGRQQMPGLGAQEGRQPSLSAKRVKELVKQDGAPLLRYLKEFISRLQEASSLG